MSNPFDQFDTLDTAPAAPAPIGARSIPGTGPKPPAPRDPLAVRKDELAIQKAERDLAKPDSTDAPSGYRWGPGGSLVAIPGGPADKPAAQADDAKAQSKLANLNALEGQINRVQELFNSGQRDNAIPLLGSLWEYLPTQANTQFDSAAAGLAEQGLAAFRVPGVGAQSDTELKQFVEANKPSSWSNDSSNEERLRQLRARVDETRAAMGLPPAQWAGVNGEQDNDTAPALNGGGSVGGTGNAPPASPSLSAQPDTLTLDSEQKLVRDPNQDAIQQGYLAMLERGEDVGRVVAFLRFSGVNDPRVLKEAAAQVKFRKNNPGVPLRSYDVSGIGQRYEPTSAWEGAMTAAGDTALGTYAMKAGQMLSGNTLDNLSVDPERARDALDVADETNPGAAFMGNMSGALMAGATGEAALARLGMAPGLVRGFLADVGAGSAQGAGAADNGNRATGAAQGAISTAVGNLLGTGAMKGAARIAAPTGGKMRPLYDAGVRPTPGQRFAESGTAGRLLNATEEALQSVPVVGSAIRGAREGARDQFQVGAFNQALAEIGEELPKGMKPGNDPHKFAQEAFNRVYTEARSGMRLVADEQLANDLAALAPDIETLGEFGQQTVKRVMATKVNRHLVNGVMEGNGYKSALSDLGKEIARYSSGSGAFERHIGEVLSGVRDALESSARRNSDPEAVALLDAADAGYAKLVRIEDAAARRGGDSGTFSPTHFDGAVQRTSGGVRSKAYLRGDALMQDYANAGKGLADKLPNSGTADRVMAGYAVGTPAAGTAAFFEPATAAVLGTIAGVYAPGVRKVVAGAMAPRGPRGEAISRQLQKRARLLGRVGAAGGAVASLETTRGQ